MRTVIPADGYALLTVHSYDDFYYYRQPVLAFLVCADDELDDPLLDVVTFTGDKLESDHENNIIAALVLPDERVVFGGSFYHSIRGFVNSLKATHEQAAKRNAATVADLV